MTTETTDWERIKDYCAKNSISEPSFETKKTWCGTKKYEWPALILIIKIGDQVFETEHARATEEDVPDLLAVQAQGLYLDLAFPIYKAPNHHPYNRFEKGTQQYHLYDHWLRYSDDPDEEPYFNVFDKTDWDKPRKTTGYRKAQPQPKWAVTVSYQGIQVEGTNTCPDDGYARAAQEILEKMRRRDIIKAKMARFEHHFANQPKRNPNLILPRNFTPQQLEQWQHAYLLEKSEWQIRPWGQDYCSYNDFQPHKSYFENTVGDLAQGSVHGKHGTGRKRRKPFGGGIPMVAKQNRTAPEEPQHTLLWGYGELWRWVDGLNYRADWDGDDFDKNPPHFLETPRSYRMRTF